MAMSRARTSRSSFGGPRAATIVSRRWQPTSFNVRSPSWSRRGAPLRHGLPKLRRRRLQSSLRWAATPSSIGLVANLGRPGGNATGVTFHTGQLHAKRLELLRELVPNAGVIAFLANPNNPTFESNVKAVEDTASSVGQQVRVLKASTAQEIDVAFTALVQLRAGALLVASEGFFLDRREQIAALTARYRVPASFELREFVTAGGLMSYGASLQKSIARPGSTPARSSMAPSRLICRFSSQRRSNL